MKLYYSYRVEDEKVVDFDNPNFNIIFGKAHYSYKIAAKKFLDLLKKNEVELYEIIRPEMFKHEISFNYIPKFDKNGNNIHLIFKPIEHINPLKNAKNIGIFAWEFDKINTEDINGNPFMNQKRMLNLLDEIWVPANFTKRVLEKFGFENVYFIPAPIKEPIDLYENETLWDLIGNMISVKLHSAPVNEKPLVAVKENVDFSKINKTYFAILNPWDYRKNFPNLLKTFMEFANNHKDVLFIVKVIIDNKTTFLNNINEILYLNLGYKNLKSDNIIMISEYIPEKTLFSIMKKVDYYYNLSFAEGQFLPILESMIVGTVPISPDKTAMEDYITQENSFVIPSKLAKADPRSNAFFREDFMWFEPDLNEALKQLENSYNVSEETYKEMSENAKQKVKEVYGENIILNKIKDRING
jgi:hypothetical protein